MESTSTAKEDGNRSTSTGRDKGCLDCDTSLIDHPFMENQKEKEETNQGRVELKISSPMSMGDSKTIKSEQKLEPQTKQDKTVSMDTPATSVSVDEESKENASQSAKIETDQAINDNIDPKHFSQTELLETSHLQPSASSSPSSSSSCTHERSLTIDIAASSFDTMEPKSEKVTIPCGKGVNLLAVKVPSSDEQDPIAAVKRIDIANEDHLRQDKDAHTITILKKSGNIKATSTTAKPTDSTSNQSLADSAGAAIKEFQNFWKARSARTSPTSQLFFSKQQEAVTPVGKKTMERGEESPDDDQSARNEVHKKDSNDNSLMDSQRKGSVQSNTQEKNSPTRLAKLAKQLLDEDSVQSERSSSSIAFFKKSRLLGGMNSMELAHKLKQHTYRSPTKCDICSGLLVGIFNQGLQCEGCGMNVHHGQGKGDHDDCRAECLLLSCPGEREDSKSSKNEEPKRLADSLKEVREFARKSPNFMKDVREQIDRDFKSHAKKLVVKSGAEDERTKKLRRLRDQLVPFLERIDAIQNRGMARGIMVVLWYHILFLLTIACLAGIGFFLALWPTERGASIVSLLRHSSTVLVSLQFAFLVLSFVIRRMAVIVRRKANIMNQFLQDLFTIDAEKDIGISVAGAVTRARYWSDCFVYSSLILLILMGSTWYGIQTLHLSDKVFVDTCPVCPESVCNAMSEILSSNL